MAKKNQNWIQRAVRHPGALRRKLRVPQGKPIPAAKLEIKPGDSPETKRQKNLARTLRRIGRKRRDRRNTKRPER